jgi:hypothetical protein
VNVEYFLLLYWNVFRRRESSLPGDRRYKDNSLGDDYGRADALPYFAFSKKSVVIL